MRVLVFAVMVPVPAVDEMPTRVSKWLVLILVSGPEAKLMVSVSVLPSLVPVNTTEVVVAVAVRWTTASDVKVFVRVVLVGTLTADIAVSLLRVTVTVWLPKRPLISIVLSSYSGRFLYLFMTPLTMSSPDSLKPAPN